MNAVTPCLDLAARQLIDAAPCGMLLVDHDGKILLANQQLHELFGYADDTLVGHAMEMLIPARYRAHHADNRAQYAVNPQLRQMGPGRDLTGQHSDGREFPVEIGLSALDLEGEQTMLATVIDISERKRMELSLRQANESLDEFTYVASHDLRSPLRGIADLLEWVEEDLGSDLPEDVSRNMDRIKLRIHRMESLIDDLLAYARAGYLTTEFTPVNLPELLKGILEMQGPSDSFQITFDCQVEDIVSPRTPLETVLRNLVSNALKHHDQAAGKILITAQPSGSHVIFTVEDDGPGIPEEAQERIFKLFQTLKSKERQSGIGLALSKRLVNAHGGEITASPSEHLRGACFRFSWPRFSRSDLDD